MTTNIREADSSRNKYGSYIFAWLRQVDADRETSAQEFRLAYVLSQLFNKKTNSCFPLQATLATRLDVSVRAIGGYVSNLVERGHLHVTDRGRELSSIYAPVLQDRNKTSDLTEVRPEGDFGSSVVEVQQDRKSDVARPEISRRKTGTVLPIEPTSVTNLNNQERGAPERADAALSGGEIPFPVLMTPSMRSRALERAGWNSSRAGIEYGKFRHHCLSNGKRSHDWEAEWWLWVERGAEYEAKAKEAKAKKPGKVIDQDGNDFASSPERTSRHRKKSNLEKVREARGGSL
jgi:hypothetical protein